MQVQVRLLLVVAIQALGYDFTVIVLRAEYKWSTKGERASVSEAATEGTFV